MKLTNEIDFTSAQSVRFQYRRSQRFEAETTLKFSQLCVALHSVHKLPTFRPPSRCQNYVPTSVIINSSISIQFWSVSFVTHLRVVSSTGILNLIGWSTFNKKRGTKSNEQEIDDVYQQLFFSFYFALWVSKFVFNPRGTSVKARFRDPAGACISFDLDQVQPALRIIFIAINLSIGATY